MRFRVLVPFAGTLNVPPGAIVKSIGLNSGFDSIMLRIPAYFLENENSISRS